MHKLVRKAISFAVVFGLIVGIAWQVSAAIVTSIDDDFIRSGSIAPWSPGEGWKKKTKNGTTEASSSPPGEKQAYFSHDGTAGTVSIEINPDGTSTRGGIITTDALNQNSIATLSLSVTLTSLDNNSYGSRLYLIDNPGLSTGSANNRIYVEVTDKGSRILVKVNSNGASLLTVPDVDGVSGPGDLRNVGTGDILAAVYDATEVISLTYFDASAANTYTLVDTSNKFAHNLNWETDFSSGIYLAEEYSSKAVGDPMSLTFDRLQAVVAQIPEPGSLLLLGMGLLGLVSFVRRKGLLLNKS